MEEREDNLQPERAQQPRWKAVALATWRWVKRLVVAVLFLLLSIVLLLQVPAVQNWAAKKVTLALSKTLETTVSVKRLNLAFLDRLVLEEFYVEGLNPGDTTIFSKRLYANISLNPFIFLVRGLVIEEVTLDSAIINIRTPEGAAQNNIQILLGRLFPPDTTALRKDKRPFKLDVKKLSLANVHLLQDDKVKGKRLSVFLQKGELEIEELNLPENYIHARSVSLQGPYVRIDDYPENPLPGADTAVSVPPIDAAEEDSRPFYATIGQFRLEEGKFSLHNWLKAPVKTSPIDELDFKHLDVYDINIGIDYFSFCSDSLDFEGQVRQLSLRDLSGFVLENLSVEQGRVWCKGVELNGLKLKTPYSEIGDTLIFKYNAYEDFTDFPNRVRMYGYLDHAQVRLRDIMTFATGLKQNTFFRLNKDRLLFINGLVKGRVSNLDGQGLSIALEDNSFVMEGEFRSRDLNQRQSETLNLNLSKLKTSMSTLRQLIPNFAPPPNFDRLGRLNFQGRFDGYFSDFVAYGELASSLGQARMDMRMNLKQGRAKANYSGKLTLTNFDLGTWSQNPDFGLVNFTSAVNDGFGLTAETARANLSAEVQSFVFKGYNYQKASLTGELKKNLFSGQFAIQDDNIDFSFLGKVDFTDTIPAFNFNAFVNKLDLKKLNLAEQDMAISGAISLDLKDSRFSNMQGTGQVKNFLLQHGRLGNISVDSVYFSSQFIEGGKKRFLVKSDIADASLEGVFDIEQVSAAFMQYLSRNFPEFFQRLGLKAPEKEVRAQSFAFKANIFDTKSLLAVFDDRLGPIQGGTIEGYFDNVLDSMWAYVYLPQFSFDKTELNETGILLKLEQSSGNIDLAVAEPVLNHKTYLSPIKVLGFLERDTFEVALAYESEGMTLLDRLHLNARLFMPDSLNYRVEFSQSNLVLMETPWLINDRNYITFRKGHIDTKNFLLTNGERQIKLEGVRNKGLKLGLYNFDFSFIDEIWDYEALDFAGRFNIVAEVENIFQLSNIKATVLADTLLVNGDDWGALRLDAETTGLKSPFHAFLSITNDTSQLLAEGFYNPADTGEAGDEEESGQANYFDFNLDIVGFPVAIAEYWIGSSVSNTVGSFNANLRIHGLPKAPRPSGFITVRDGAVTVDYLQTRYTFSESLVSVNDYLFDASGTIVRDELNNTATVKGGVTHDHLKNLGIAARLETGRFLALNTKKGDNELFYGRAIGQGEVLFNGPFDKVDIYVNATVGEGTRLVIPVSYGGEASELSFIRFRQRQEEGDKDRLQRELTGVNLEMDLTVTEEAQGEIVFDEQAGDIIKGNGRGNIRILVPRNGDFQMFGDYVIEKGDYLFTLYNVVNKEFSIKKGGVISWSGEPFGAQIRLEAEYEDLSTSVANFIQEYLTEAPPEVRNDASKATDVNLTMDLRGDLLQPVINFDISFPQLTGAVQTLTDSKLRVIKQDPNELNRQVFGLIVVGQFLPSDLAIQGSEIFYNTVSEFVSNQLSLLLTELFSEFFSDGSLLSGIDFDIAYNQYQADLGSNEELRRGDEFQVRLRQEFFNDRLTIQVGGNVDIGNSAYTTPGASGTFVGNDLVIEYVLNRDRTLKLRVYQRLEPDIGGGSRLEVGTGLSYRKEFDNFGEFIRSFRKDGKRVKD
ncbi:MAG: translocation/assembly module TamB domain-containing protein [Lewinellaceae bacterium]|nr:translocation/assembly module TamB domain-containing protein [Phaeodactylibacter sp.]MCB9348971.1 translocation/assembly module TamB domain-containing protein [Lewinellaceae bacterium]